MLFFLLFLYSSAAAVATATTTVTDAQCWTHASVATCEADGCFFDPYDRRCFVSLEHVSSVYPCIHWSDTYSNPEACWFHYGCQLNATNACVSIPTPTTTRKGNSSVYYESLSEHYVYASDGVGGTDRGGSVFSFLLWFLVAIGIVACLGMLIMAALDSSQTPKPIENHSAVIPPTTNTLQYKHDYYPSDEEESNEDSSGSEEEDSDIEQNKKKKKKHSKKKSTNKKKTSNKKHHYHHNTRSHK